MLIVQKNTENFLILKKRINELNSHLLFKKEKKFTKEELKIFMEYHVFAVWDFMSIVKELQHHICPSGYPWAPSKYTKNGIAHLINEITFSEESDKDKNGRFFSHFDLYIMAMKDIDANTENINKFIGKYCGNSNTLSENINGIDIPQESLEFVRSTFDCLSTNKISNIAAIFTYGRENTIPDMFIKILNKIDSNNLSFSNLRLYINRHIEIDSSRHGPLSLKLFEHTCDNNQEIYDEAIEYAIISIDKRIGLWDGVLRKITKLR